MTEGKPLPEPAPLPPPEAALPSPEQASSVVAQISAKINALTELPYDLLARWKIHAPEAAKALLERAVDHTGPLGKLVSPVIEKLSEFVGEVGVEKVVGIYRLGSMAVKGFMAAKGYAVDLGSNAIELGSNLAEAFADNLTGASVESKPQNSIGLDGQFMSKAAGAAKTTLDLSLASNAKDMANLDTKTGDANNTGIADPKGEKVHLPEYNEKTGEGSIWFALNDKDKGIASLLGYDNLTKKQQHQLTEFVLKENDMSWKKASSISEFTMPSHDKLEAKLKEIGAAYNPQADKRDTLEGSGQQGGDPADEPDKKPPTQQPPQRGGEGGQPVTPSPSSPPSSPSPQPEPTQTQPPPPTSAPPPSPTLETNNGALTQPEEGLSRTNLILGGIATLAVFSVGTAYMIARGRRNRDHYADDDEIPPEELVGKRRLIGEDDDDDDRRPTGEDFAEARAQRVLRETIRREARGRTLPANLDSMNAAQLRELLQDMREPIARLE